MDAVEQRVFEALSKVIGDSAATLQPETRFVDDLGVDSLFAIEMALSLECAFDIEVEDEELPQLQTVQNVLDFIRGKIASKIEPA